MNLKQFTGAAFAAALLAGGAQAATITNNEAKPQTVKVYSADRQETFTIMPSDTITVDHICQNDCVLALQNGDEFEFARNDDLLLEEGAVYSNPPAQGAGEPPPPAQQQ